MVLEVVKASLKARGHFLAAEAKQLINNEGAGAGAAAAALEHPENAIVGIAWRSANCPGNLLKGNSQMHVNISKIYLQLISKGQEFQCWGGGLKSPKVFVTRGF